MAQIIQTADLDRDTLSESEKLWVYNGLDCCITYEVKEEVQTHMSPENLGTYNFEQALQAPALDMMLRGVLIDQQVRHEQITEFTSKAQKLESILEQFADAAWGQPLNAKSPKQIAEFFYDHMGLPLISKKNKQTGKVGPDTSREALEKLQVYFYAKPFVKLILGIKDSWKKVSTLRSGIDKDGRMRVSYNVAGTETGRWSSNKNCFGGGMNFQNLTEALRKMIIADPGMKMCYMDLEQAESRGVAYLSGDEDYIEACESGDLHSTVCQMVWPQLAWTGNLEHDKNKVAEQIFYLHYSYRDMAKRGGHGTNYYGTPFTMARHLKVTQEVMESFQDQYFTAFPGIPAWHQNVAERLQTQRAITTPLGRKRIFFGRPNDDSTLREAIAFEPQSTIADSLNLGLWRVWKHAPWIQLLGQVHDAILFQYPEEREAEALELVSKLLLVEISVHGRTLVIPNEAQVGWNWMHYDPINNPDGIKKWKGNDDRIRSSSPKTSVLDIRLS
jgi:DNA polymerase I-like protein with 3'-5' exonuclease and polymerase domains